MRFKIGNYLNQIRFKLFVMCTFLPIGAVFLLGYIAYHYAIDLLTGNEYERMNSIAQTADNQLNQYITETRQTLSNTISALEESDFSENKIQSILSFFKSNTPAIFQNMYYITNKGKLYQAEYNWNPITDELMKIYQEAVASDSLYVIGPNLMDKDGVVVLIATKVRKGTAVEGVIAVSLKLITINEAIEKIDYDKRFSMLLLNGSMRPVISDIKIDYSRYLRLLPQIRAWVQNPHHVNKLEDDKLKTNVLITGRPIGFHDWYLIYFVDENLFLSKVFEFKKYTLYIAIIFSVAIILISLNLTRYINKPISKLVGDINKIKSGHLHTRIHLQRKDEFMTLANSFNEMLDRIEFLIDEKSRVEVAKKQFELKALQAQINPHFLFNTLNCINSLLDLGRMEQIPVVIRSLVRLFHYTMDKQQEWVDIATELKGLSYYIELQQIRYQNKFRVDIDIPEPIMKYGILKLTLQPIVENSIFHGIKEKRERGQIKVGGYKTNHGGSLILFVEDNGCGIPSERLAHLLDPGEDTDAVSDLRGFNSIGLRNVHERLQLHFGDGYGLRVKSAPGLGTRVEIHYPAIEIKR